MTESRSVRCQVCGRHCTLLLEQTEKGHALHPAPGVIPCIRGLDLGRLLDHPARLRTPLRRVGPRGDGRWEAISWEEAIGEIGRRLAQIRSGYGPESLFTATGADRPIVDGLVRRFASAYGTPWMAWAGHICHILQYLAMEEALGTPVQAMVTEETGHVLLWGSDPASTAPAAAAAIRQAQRRGVPVTVVDPRPTYFAKKGLHLPIRPGTDLALLLGLLREVLSCRPVPGWPYAEELEPYDLVWTERETGVAPALVRETARRLLEHPTCIMGGNALHQNEDSYDKGTALALLAALSGNWDRPGCLRPCPPPDPRDRIAGGALADEAACTARYLAHRPQGQRESFLWFGSSHILDGIDRGVIRAGLCVASNPVQSWAGGRETTERLSALELLVVMDYWMTPTARLADLVLPAMTYLESDYVELGRDGIVRAWTPRVYGTEVPDGRHEAETLGAIASAAGLSWPWKDGRAFWEWILEPYGLDLDTLQKAGTRDCGSAEDGRPLERQTPPSQLPPPPQYRPPVRREGWPWYCTCYKPGWLYLSQGRELGRGTSPEVWIAPDAASAEGIHTGQRVRIETPWGAVIQTARIVEGMALGTVAVLSGWRYLAGEGRPVCEASSAELLPAREGVGTKIPSTLARGLPCRLTAL